MFKDSLEILKYYIFRDDQGYWNIPRWHFARCNDEVNHQIYAMFVGWADEIEIEGYNTILYKRILNDKSR